jgi:protein KTI12
VCREPPRHLLPSPTFGLTNRTEIHVGTPVATCREINTQRLNDQQPSAYESDLFDNLIFRYEEPNGMNRWDSPLFTVVHDDEHPQYDQIWDALFAADGKGRAVRPNAATVLAPVSQQNALYELDRQTTDIVGRILTWQQDHPGEPGGEVTIPEVEESVRLPAGLTSGPVSSPQLQRLRRQFVQLNRQHQLEKSRIRHLFVDYLNDVFERME